MVRWPLVQGDISRTFSEMRRSDILNECRSLMLEFRRLEHAYMGGAEPTVSGTKSAAGSPTRSVRTVRPNAGEAKRDWRFGGADDDDDLSTKDGSRAGDFKTDKDVDKVTKLPRTGGEPLFSAFLVELRAVCTIFPLSLHCRNATTA